MIGRTRTWRHPVKRSACNENRRISSVHDLCAPLPRRNGLFRRRGKASPNKRPGQKLAMKYFDRAGRFRGAHKSRTWCFLGVFDGRGTHKSGTCPHAGGGNPACFSPRSAHYAIEGSRIRHRQKDFLLTPHGILRVPASRGLPALASRAREFYSPLDCRMLALAQDDSGITPRAQPRRRWPGRGGRPPRRWRPPP